MSEKDTHYKENKIDLKKLRGMEETILERAARQGFFKKRL